MNTWWRRIEPTESNETYSAGSDDTERRGNEVGRQMDDEYASKSGDTVSGSLLFCFFVLCLLLGRGDC